VRFAQDKRRAALGQWRVSESEPALQTGLALLLAFA
jgi:uncharacterized membrane protein YsdA (DUF1294 family)